MAKKKDPSGFYNPFWTDATIDIFGASNVRSFTANHSVSIMEYRNETHLPFYVLPRIAQRTIDSVYYNTRGCKADEVPQFVRSMTVIKDPKVKKLMTSLWEQKKYEQFMLGLCSRVENSSVSAPGMVDRIKGAWRTAMTEAADTKIMLPNFPSCTGALNIVKQLKVGTHFGLGNVHSKTVKTGPWAHPRYVYGRYFLAYMYDLATNGQPVFSHGGTQFDTNFVPVPLMSLMFKVEHLNLLRGYMLNNKEVPAELLELWVDASLDDIGSQHPVRLQYLRNVKKPLVEAGVTIKVVPNLDELMYDRMTVPKFKSVKQQKDWASLSVEGVLDKERMDNGIVTKKEHLDKTLDAIFSAKPVTKIINGTSVTGTPITDGPTLSQLEDIFGRALQ